MSPSEMIGGEAATRIYHEVLKGITESTTDTEDQADYRRRVVESVRKIKEQGGGFEPINEIP